MKAIDDDTKIEILRLRGLGLTYSQIAAKTKRTRNSIIGIVTREIEKAKKEVNAETPGDGIDKTYGNTKNIGTTSKHIETHRNGFDWDNALDNAGLAVDKLVRKGLDSKDEKMFRWAVETLFKGAQAKMGVLRIQNTLNVGVVVYGELDDGQKDVVRREVVKELFCEYREADVCPMCGQPKPIDVAPMEVKS